MKIPGMISVGGAKSVLTFVVAATAVNALAEFAGVNRITTIFTMILMVAQIIDYYNY